MDWFATIDAYCERTDPSFWSEPVNAISNAAFLLAVVPALIIRRRQDQHDLAITMLLTLVCLIGIGSFLFHTFATRWASLADVIPITVFILAYFAFAMSRFVGLSRLKAALATGAFFVSALLIEPLLAPILGSSAAYAPGLLALIGVGSFLAIKRRREAVYLLSAAAVFTASIGFRMADLPLCDSWPLGTHFLWHSLNGLMLCILLLATLTASPRDGRIPASDSERQA